jgi:hypothetical protein
MNCQEITESAKIPPPGAITDEMSSQYVHVNDHSPGMPRFRCRGLRSVTIAVKTPNIYTHTPEQKREENKNIISVVGCV